MIATNQVPEVFTQQDFDRAIAHSRERIAGCDIAPFAVPHIVIDDVMPPDVLERINAAWPGRDAFNPEIPGNFVQVVSPSSMHRFAPETRSLWSDLRERYWFPLMAMAAERLSGLINPAFNELLEREFSLEVPLALMEADERFAGHQPHTHFYHNPNWVFTALFYADPDDTISQGTTLLRAPLHPAEPSNYLSPDARRRAELAMDTLAWPEETFEARDIAYKANRLLVFLDGPLAFHSVRYTMPNFQPDPKRALEPQHARRRILRTHAKVELDRVMAAFTPPHFPAIEHERYKRLMQKNPTLSLRDRIYRQIVIGGFYRRAVLGLAHACKAPGRGVPYERLLEQIVRRAR